MKKILFIISSLRCGGAETLLLDILLNFDYKKYDVTLLLFNKDKMLNTPLPNHVKIKYAIGFGPRSNHYKRLVLSKLGLIDAFYKRQICKSVDSNYDTIVSFLEGFPVRAHYYLLNRSVNNISFIHTDLYNYADSALQFTGTLTQDEIYRKMDKLVFVSQNAQKGFVKRYPHVSTSYTILRNFVDLDKIRIKANAFDYSNQFFTIVSVGRVTEVKGYDILPEIASILKAKKMNIKFLVVGDGGYMDKLRQLIKKTHTEDMFELKGFQPNPYPFIKKSNLLISTSHTEGFPLTFCEAMCLGIPILASKTAGAVELLESGVGILVERDVDEYVNWIEQLFYNKDIYINYKNKSLAYSSNFDKDKYMQKLYMLL